MKPALVILAAGMGSRYGGLKQMDGVGPNEETIIDYSVFDAIRSGFGKVVFVIRESFLKDFKTKVTAKFSDLIKVKFAFQELEPNIPGLGIIKRSKPWGTGHAVLVAKDYIEEPFAVINADDYYGVHSFQKMSEFLINSVKPDRFSMVGFQLNKTLSKNGSVSRGICEMDESQYLTSVVERTKISILEDQILFTENGLSNPLSAENMVSMNFWGFHPTFFIALEKAFFDFAKTNQVNPGSEFYIPLVVSQLIKEGEVKVKVLKTNDQWHGVTYSEDKPKVQSAIKTLVDKEIYNSPLWST